MLQSFQQRYWLVGMSALAVFICYIDRVNISVAIIPMAETHGWSPKTQGLVLSSFFVGYLLLQIVGGRLSDRFGGKIVLGCGVLLWSLFTILTPLAASASIAVLIVTRILMGMGLLWLRRAWDSVVRDLAAHRESRPRSPSTDNRRRAQPYPTGRRARIRSATTAHYGFPQKQSHLGHYSRAFLQ